jgi:hypothetical protein
MVVAAAVAVAVVGAAMVIEIGMQLGGVAAVVVLCIERLLTREWCSSIPCDLCGINIADLPSVCAIPHSVLCFVVPTLFILQSSRILQCNLASTTHFSSA